MHAIKRKPRKITNRRVYFQNPLTNNGRTSFYEKSILTTAKWSFSKIVLYYHKKPFKQRKFSKLMLLSAYYYVPKFHGINNTEYHEFHTKPNYYYHLALLLLPTVITIDTTIYYSLPDGGTLLIMVYNNN